MENNSILKWLKNSLWGEDPPVPVTNFRAWDYGLAPGEAKLMRGIKDAVSDPTLDLIGQDIKDNLLKKIEENNTASW